MRRMGEKARNRCDRHRDVGDSEKGL